MGLIQSVAHHLFAGRVQIFSINSINPWAWMNEGMPIHEKARNQVRFSDYVEQEVVPHIRRYLRNDHARIGVGEPGLLPAPGPVRGAARVGWLLWPPAGVPPRLLERRRLLQQPRLLRSEPARGPNGSSGDLAHS
jgi:hypothetical protein